jgi:putative Mn2+ efflux pump MntP
LQVFLIAVALGADAFSVALGVGLGQVGFRQKFRLSFHFGLFQFFMPIVGWLLGFGVFSLLDPVKRWVAFALLSGIGVKMVYESFVEEENKRVADPTRGLSLVILSFATSIDAFGVGFSMAMLFESFFLPCLVIGLVAAGMTLLGIELGDRIASKVGKRVESLGGIILIVIGIKILVS